MPELPEVETIVRDLRPQLTGCTITGVWIGWARTVATPDFERRVVGQTITGVGRRGKYLTFALSGGDTLLIHLKMTGRLQVMPAGAPRLKHDRVIFTLDDGRELHFNDSRKFGRVYVVADPAQALASLGPEPLDDDFTAADFAALIARRKGRLKPLLLNQAFLAGVGNIYADEALFVAGLHPQRRADTLSTAQIEDLYRAIRHVLREAIRHEGTTVSWYRKVNGDEGQHQNHLLVYGRRDEPCTRCGEPIRRIVVGGRGTHFCPRCQRWRR